MSLDLWDFSPLVNMIRTILLSLACVGALRFPVTLKTGQRLVCRDQHRWGVVDGKRSKTAEGELAAAPPVLQGGSNRISFTCKTPDRAVVRLVKVYES
jgi:hypothetical protein